MSALLNELLATLTSALCTARAVPPGFVIFTDSNVEPLECPMLAPRFNVLYLITLLHDLRFKVVPSNVLSMKLAL